MAERCRREHMFKDLGCAVAALNGAAPGHDYTTKMMTVSAIAQRIKDCPCGECCARRALRKMNIPEEK